uniref:Uncharacterized protein n=1 Tax=Glossina morsitans morsitans TaxID=37546 RepID=A0A1B0GBY6_GLOMM
MSKNASEKDVVDLSATALVELLRSQPNLAEDIPVLGHIPKLLRLLASQPRNTLSILHQLSLSEFCVRAIFQTECISPLKKCMQYNRNCIETSCETLIGLIPFLLSLLDSRLDYVAVKTQIVAALKGMRHNLNYDDRVTQILLKHPVWSEFKDQRHDQATSRKVQHKNVEVLTSPPPIDRGDPSARLPED